MSQSSVDGNTFLIYQVLIKLSSFYKMHFNFRIKIKTWQRERNRNATNRKLKILMSGSRRRGFLHLILSVNLTSS